MRICLFGQGPLCDAIEVALEAAGHELLGPFSSPQPTDVLNATQASVGLSAGYRHKLIPEEWGCFPDGILNLHTGYLPWNKGAYPNVWPLLDGSPAGVTLHRVDEGIDTGPILAQVKVEVEPTDTAKTLYDKLILVGVGMVDAMFKGADLPYEVQGYGITGTLGFPKEIPQDPNAGSFHRKADWSTHQQGYDWWDDDTKALWNKLRAATFPGYGLRYRQDGKLIEATITLKEVTE